ncbi:MAG: hypothetical protein LC797_22085 [Chloroflexi bacterium]|nr:hypothetical protein [Chloroflexota bacterium]
MSLLEPQQQIVILLTPREYPLHIGGDSRGAKVKVAGDKFYRVSRKN